MAGRRSVFTSEALARMAAEAVLIVASILLAFGLDAWWSDRERAVEERETLVRLRAEVEANLAQLELKRGEHESVRDAAVALLELTGARPTRQVDPDSVGQLLWDVTYSASYDPANGVVTSLLASGSLGLIRSDSLRIELAGWPALVVDLQEDEQAAWRIVDARFTPFLDRFISWRNVVTRIGTSPGITSGGFSHDLESMLRDREFENLVSGRIWYVDAILRPYDSVESSLRRTLRLIDSELDLSG